MSDRLRLIWLWLSIGFVGCAVLLYACLMPSPPQPQGIHLYDKMIHCLSFLVLSVWFAGVLNGRYLRVFIGLAAFGAAIELIQSVTAYRNGDILDLVADTVGVVAGLGLARLGVMQWLDVVDRYVVSKRNQFPGA